MQLQSEVLKETLGWSDEAMHDALSKRISFSRNQSSSNSGMPLTGNDLLERKKQ